MTAIEGAAADAGGRVVVLRHRLIVRVTHWVNVLAFVVLLATGLQIFNAHPRLYWGAFGADHDPFFLAIGAEEGAGGVRGYVRVAGLDVTTTGVLGASKVDGEWTGRAFPGWATIPSYQDLATGRRWHFFFAWLLVANGLVYLVYGLLSGHARRDLAPTAAELAPRHLLGEVVDHLHLRFPQGEAARRYNTLQKLAYCAAAFLLLPLMVLTGLTMSPGIDAAWPWLLDLFDGRQSARTIHFLTASALVVFVLVHVLMVLLSGPLNNLRSMITGRYAIRTERAAR